MSDTRAGNRAEPMWRRSALSLCLLPLSGLAQRHPARLTPHSGESADIQLPNGQSQTDEILKVEREENLKDAAKLADLADELKESLEKEDWFVFSLNTDKKTEEIEKLARKIRARMRHE